MLDLLGLHLLMGLLVLHLLCEVAGFDIRKLVNCLEVRKVHTRAYLVNLLTLHMLLGLVLRLSLLLGLVLRLLRMDSLLTLRCYLSLPAAGIAPLADVHDKLPLGTRQQSSELVRDSDHQIVILWSVVSRVQNHDDPANVRARDGYPHDSPNAPLLAAPHPFEVVEGGIVDRLLPRREAHVIDTAREAAANVETWRADSDKRARKQR